MLRFDDLAFFDSHIFATLAVRLTMRLLDGDDAHLHGNQAAIHFDGAEGEIHVCLAAKNREVASLLNGANLAVDARAGRKKQLTAKIDRFGHDGDERVPFARDGGMDVAQKREMNLRALHHLTRLGVRRGRGGANKRGRQKNR